MDNTEMVRKGITELEKDISLLQISKQSGISYLTLRKIKTGETKTVSSGVASKFEKFKNSFVPGSGSKVRPGPKPKAASATAAPAKKKPGRPKKADAAPKAAAPAKKKPGRPKKTATPVKQAAANTAPVTKTTTKKAAPKKKAGRPKKAAATKPAQATSRSDFGTPMLGEALYREIEIAQARLEYLRSLQMVEEEFLKAIGKK